MGMDIRMQNYLKRIRQNEQRNNQRKEQSYGFVAEGPPPVNEQPKKNKKKRVG